MRIAIPIHSFEPGGVERVALRLAARWQASGHSVVIVLGRNEGCCAGEAPALDYRSIPEPVLTLVTHLLAGLTFALADLARGTRNAIRNR